MSKLRDKMLARQREMKEAAAFGPISETHVTVPESTTTPAHSLAGPEPKPAPKEPLKTRLPIGSSFSAVYMAAGQWEGVLLVPTMGRCELAPNVTLSGPPSAAARFQASAPSIKKLLFALDDLYRAYLKEQEAAK